MHELDEEQLRTLLPGMRRFARSLVADAGSADDLVQAALERALSRWRTRRDSEALRPWLFQILYRQFIDETRRNARRQRLALLFGAQAQEAAPSAERVHDGRAVLAQFNQLPSDHRALLMLVAVEGFSYREAADALGLPMGTVMSRLSRARDRLRMLEEGQTHTNRPLRGVP
ncbi:sigma-70 family RNA polymerase sigma factor [Stenotrophomonas tumulicola]|uniref:Sigma-70 family RNA polymerase sigma factor n=1 Tax=Stenotrophomonas tumulicola TaxID=1685415 RepID=A0A7W3FKK7_9GAMM|nr:sigma-70 family RNA polymerase sigma factor [Stenotrophomonas tumulicola]MBA8680941.1 sigma-70 family RNA polymerase sigma factor [Stenotrophomonas tumulicola]